MMMSPLLPTILLFFLPSLRGLKGGTREVEKGGRKENLQNNKRSAAHIAPSTMPHSSFILPKQFHQLGSRHDMSHSHPNNCVGTQLYVTSPPPANRMALKILIHSEFTALPHLRRANSLNLGWSSSAHFSAEVPDISLLSCSGWPPLHPAIPDMSQEAHLPPGLPPQCFHGSLHSHRSFSLNTCCATYL